MKVSLNWLKDYVELPPLDALTHRLTMAGFEVEAVHRPGQALEGVVVARIAESRPHPNADKLSVTRIDAGGEPLQVVCGAKNYQVGDKVPLATVGTTLPNGVTIARAALRGVESAGMLCSARELGLAEDAAGLMILDPALEVGTPLAAALGKDDVVLEVNVNPNRPDALSHLGLAREVAVLFGLTLRRPSSPPREGGGRAAERVEIRIEDPERCPRYVGRVIEGVKVGPSPRWLKERLEACGVRAINNVVDVTNYVNLELGQPLHAFDLEQLAGAQLVVRTPRAGDGLTTLDGKPRQLHPDDLLICDRDRPQALAGVMGGGHSEVSARTTRVLLESAYFQPTTVRKSSKRHAIHSEASHRFERGVDVEGVPLAADRAAQLIAELASGTLLEGRVDVYPAPLPRRSVELRFERVGRFLGVEIPAAEARRILTALGFAVAREDGQAATFTVPTFRVDVEREEDLIEEVGRVYGYERIPTALPRGLSALSPEAAEVELEVRIRAALAGAGLDEVINYSFVSPRELEALGQVGPWVTLMNPLSVEQSVMRTTLFAGLLQNVSRNARNQVQTVRLYELGRTYRPDPLGGVARRPVASERLTVGGALHGPPDERSWTGKGRALDFHDAKGAVEAVLAALRIGGARCEPTERPEYHPRAAARVLGPRGEVLGSVGELHPGVAKRLDVPPDVFLFELDVEALCAAATLVPAYAPLTRFPAVLRDLAVVVPQALASEQVREVILEVGSPLVEDATVFDVYAGKPIPEGSKNLAYALRYRAKDRTLTDQEVAQAHQRIVEEVNRRLGGSLRGAAP